MLGKQRIKLIAVVEADESMQDALGDLIESGGRGKELRKQKRSDSLHRTAACLIVDIRMPKMSGLELQSRLKQQKCNVPIIFMTAFDDAELRAEAMKEGAVDFLAKPFNHQRLLKLLQTPSTVRRVAVSYRALRCPEALAVLHEVRNIL